MDRSCQTANATPEHVDRRKHSGSNGLVGIVTDDERASSGLAAVPCEGNWRISRDERPCARRLPFRVASLLVLTALAEGTAHRPTKAKVFFLFDHYSHATYLDHGEIMYSPFPVRCPRGGGTLQAPLLPSAQACPKMWSAPRKL